VKRGVWRWSAKASPLEELKNHPFMKAVQSRFWELYRGEIPSFIPGQSKVEIKTPEKIETEEGNKDTLDQGVHYQTPASYVKSYLEQKGDEVYVI